MMTESAADRTGRERTVDSLFVKTTKKIKSEFKQECKKKKKKKDCDTSAIVQL